MKLIWNTPGIIKDADKAAKAALADGGQFILEEANKTIPLDTGAMEESGTVTVSTTDPIAAVSYDTPYAPRQHEALEYRHAPGRRALWLQRTAEEQADEYAKKVAEAFRDSWGTI